MFTGIVTSTGKVRKIIKKGDSIHFRIEPVAKKYLNDRKIGQSIAINGACMTITKIFKNTFEFTTVKESLSKTNLGFLIEGSYVNLEKPLKINEGIDGHIVQGHVDTTGEVYKINQLKDSWEFFFKFSSIFRKYLIYVGSITVNGISLTVADIIKDSGKDIIIKIAIIPHTYNVTNFKYLKKGDKVNLEFDMLGKFVLRILNKFVK